MEKPPIIDSIKKLALGKQGEDFDDEEMTDAQQDILEFYRVQPTIEIPESVLTPSEVKSVKFQKTTPWGLHPEQVGGFIDQLGPTIEFYIKAMETRDRDINRLANQLDKSNTDIQNLKFQVEMFQGAGAAAVVDKDGNFVSESDLSDTELRLEHAQSEIQDLQNKLLMARKDLEVAQSQQVAVGGAGLDDAERQELIGLREYRDQLADWERSVTERYDELETYCANLEQEIANLKEGGASQTDPEAESRLTEAVAYAESLEGQVAALTEANTTLAAQLEEASQVEASADTPDLDALNEYVDQLEGHIKVLEGQFETTHNANEQQAQRIAELESALESSQQRISELESTPPAQAGPAVVPGYRDLPPGVRPEDLLG